VSGRDRAGRRARGRRAAGGRAAALAWRVLIVSMGCMIEVETSEATSAAK